jgi:hypothetical protein
MNDIRVLYVFMWMPFDGLINIYLYEEVWVNIYLNN